MDNLKSDIINDAFSEMRLSGITVNPTSSDNAIALRRLESLMGELEGRNVTPGYNFEDSPDTGSTSGLHRKYWYPVACVLALRLLSDFGKGMKPDPVLMRHASAGMSFLYSSTAVVNQTQYSSRQHTGQGNIPVFPGGYYSEPEIDPIQSESKSMFIGDINNFIEHFDSYLIDSETISSFTITADTGLTVVSSSNADTDVTYQISAVGNSNRNETLNVKIVMTSSDGRKETRVIPFILTYSGDIS